MKPFILLNRPDTEFNCSQVDSNHSMAHAPYHYSDPIFASSLVAYGQQAINQPQLLPQMLGLTSTRVALPLDLADDGPIYVNAKQYHGILRRRQSRAKLEAKNKLIKSRKPYLHESRHRHALNRVRGSGGRFLSKKQLAQSNAELVNGAHSGSEPVNILYQKKDASKGESNSSRTEENASSSITTCFDRTCLSSNSVNFRHPERMFLGNSSNMGGGAPPQCSGGITFGGTKQRASVVR
ncbi:nuclear transcription factor Y subunit A-4-like [Gastrolobium bilobum]|uniref:nuclear transcription factor Y subunit A-4-like n=1 Tax=Gastrolobium bilobum TaxID=150636 RepID=UPI002AB16438|nr:nuclear transcription factor Y subunit A-4-like [Gastrolobium bilobum]